MISVAARLAGMHPQTLRVYEERGLIKPARSPKQTRLYSQRDVERLKRIQELTTESGMNLAGVERVLAMEEVMDDDAGSAWTTDAARDARAHRRGAPLLQARARALGAPERWARRQEDPVERPNDKRPDAS